MVPTPSNLTIHPSVVLAASQFCHNLTVTVEQLGQGNINDTYLVTTENNSFVLQRINDQVFPRPERIISNLLTISNHIAGQQLNSRQRWQNLHLIPTNRHQPWHRDTAGSVWRAVSYIDQAKPLTAVRTSKQAYQVGWALGRFHRLVHTLPTDDLYDPLPGFHILTRYLDHFDTVAKNHCHRLSLELSHALGWVDLHRKDNDILEKAKQQGILNLRPIHGDPKADNILFDQDTGLAVSIIDLDTAGAGLIQYDLGDCLRSCCNQYGENRLSDTKIHFDTDICKDLLSGYMKEAGTLLTIMDRQYIYEAVRLISFELGLRFLTDFLENNIYFKVSYPEQNLERALIQFQLMDSIQQQERTIRLLTAHIS